MGKKVSAGPKITRQAPKGGKTTGGNNSGNKKAQAAPVFDKAVFKARLLQEIDNARQEIRLELHLQWKILFENGTGVGDFETWLKEYADQYIHTQALINKNPIKTDKDFEPLLKKVSKEYKDG